MFDFFGEKDNPDDKLIRLGNTVGNYAANRTGLGSLAGTYNRLGGMFKSQEEDKNAIDEWGSPLHPTLVQQPHIDKESAPGLDPEQQQNSSEANQQIQFGKSFQVADNSNMLANTVTPEDNSRVKNGQESGIWGIIKAVI